MDFFSPRQHIFRTIGLIILIILLLLLLVDFEAVWEGLQLTDWREYTISVGFLIVAYGLITWRTRFLLEKKLGYFNALYADSSGYMFSILMQLPNAAFRVLALNRSAGIDTSLATSALTIEVITGWLARSLALLFAIVLVAADSGDAQRPILISILVVTGVTVLLFVLAKNADRLRTPLANGLARLPRISAERAEGVAVKITSLLGHLASIRRFGMAFFLTILIWLFALLFYFFSFQSMNIELTTPHLFVALAAMVVAPPTSPMMIGVFHGAVIAILGTLNYMDADGATVYAIQLHFVQMVLLVVLGVIGMRRMNLQFGAIVKEIRASTRKKS
jgi:uncharacterized membrane protein YbhN (UPF0104 family)